MSEYHDYMVRAFAEEGMIRAFAATTAGLVEEANSRAMKKREIG